MLFGRSAHGAFSFMILIAVSVSLNGEHLDKYLQQGKKMGEAFKFSELSEENIKAITPIELRNQTFDGKNAKKQLESRSHQKIENTQISELDPAVMAVIENVENSHNKEKSRLDTEADEETIETCVLENTIFSMTLHHTLNVEIIQDKPVVETIKICKGHTDKTKSSDPKKEKEKQEYKFKHDPTIKSYKVSIESKGMLHRDQVKSTWKHKNDASTCRSYTRKKIKVPSKKWEEVDTWQMDTTKNFNSRECTVTKTIDGPAETRTINGREIKRHSWNKTQYFQCVCLKHDGCEFLKEKNCVLTAENCLRKERNQCLLFEKIFKCRLQKKPLEANLRNIYGSDSSLWDTFYQPNKDMPAVATKLAIFDEMKKELENSQTADARTFQIFGGYDQKCSTNIADKVIYDCCESMDGFATQIKLSKCTSNEIALAEAKKKGLAHYVGKKKKEFLSLWVSRTDHVYCVFPTKLSRVFQEEARKQLKMNWGDADKPDCRGLTQEEIKKVDFSKLDLVEAFEIPKQIDHQKKIKGIENRLKQRIENQ
jgi:conjugal transfer mating pair stabilization protein TraN